MRSFHICFLLLICTGAFAQDYSWWNDKHNWDGQTHWTKYMILSSAYMGPNALPVPEIKRGIMADKTLFEFALDNHFSSGDITNNLFTELFIPLAPGRAGIKMAIVPIEYYRMNTLTNDLRVSRDYDGKGFSVGDLYFSTFIQLLKDHEKLPDILLTVNLKTASGSNLEAARHTDSPAYYFDLSFGREFIISSQNLRSVRAHAMAGFYVWQTHQDMYYQNDAFLYGCGVDLSFKRFLMKNALGGYIGYIDNGDKPMIYRMSLASSLKTGLNYEFGFQQGIQDFAYTSFRIAFIFNFSK